MIFLADRESTPYSLGGEFCAIGGVIGGWAAAAQPLPPLLLPGDGRFLCRPELGGGGCEEGANGEPQGAERGHAEVILKVGNIVHIFSSAM